MYADGVPHGEQVRYDTRNMAVGEGRGDMMMHMPVDDADPAFRGAGPPACLMNFCGCNHREMSYLGSGQGDYVVETKYVYVGKGKGDCMPDAPEERPVDMGYGRQAIGFAVMAGLLALGCWAGYSSLAGAPDLSEEPGPGPAPAPALVTSQQQAVRATTDQFDCDEGWHGSSAEVLEAWPVDKLSFCCEHFGRGCQEVKTSAGARQAVEKPPSARQAVKKHPVARAA